MVPKVYAVAMLVTALVFWMFSFTDKSHNRTQQCHRGGSAEGTEGPPSLEILPVLL